MNVRKTVFSPTLTAYWVLELHISLLCENSCCGIIMCRLLPYNSIVLCDKFIYLFFFFCLGSYISAVVYSHPESSEIQYWWCSVCLCRSSSKLISHLSSYTCRGKSGWLITVLYCWSWVLFLQVVSSAQFSSAHISPVGLSSISRNQVLGKTWFRSVHP